MRERIMSENKAFSQRNNGDPTSALMRSLCKCGLCQYTMHVQKRPYGSDQYVCRQKTGRTGEQHAIGIMLPSVDDAAWETAKKYILDPTLLRTSVSDLIHSL